MKRLEAASTVSRNDCDQSQEIKFVVSEFIAWMKAENEIVPEPFGLKRFKGNLTLRVPPEIHRELTIRSAEEGVSVNQFILSGL